MELFCVCVYYFRLKFDTVLGMCCSCKQENVTGGSNILIVGSVLWCPWRFPHRDCVRFVFASACLREPHVLFTLFLFVCARGGIQHMLRFVLVLFPFVLCILCCQFLWIVHFFIAPLLFSLLTSVVVSVSSISAIIMRRTRNQTDVLIATKKLRDYG